ncbi:MAG: hypothetical protein JXR95_11645 [Deltaproteobacteria bacterium]|nr:hypothetical protein [Deltaproteobacteria bacterium]
MKKIIILMGLVFLVGCENESYWSAENTCSRLNRWLEQCGGQCKIDNCVEKFNALEDPDEVDFWQLYGVVLLREDNTCPVTGLGDLYLEKLNESMGVECNYYCGDGLCPLYSTEFFTEESLDSCPSDCATKYCNYVDSYFVEYHCADTDSLICDAVPECYDELVDVSSTLDSSSLSTLTECMREMGYSSVSGGCIVPTTDNGMLCEEYVSQYVTISCGK